MRSTGLAVLLAALAVAAPSAVRAGDWKCPARGGREWREVSSEHFRIVTDLSSGAGKELAQELETMHAAVRGALFRKAPPMPGVIRVVAFRSEEDYRAFAPEEADAYYAVLDGRPTVVLHGGFGEYTRIIVAHELGHHLLARVFPRQPRWFSEGLATYLETVGVNGPDATPTVGGVPQHRHRLIYPYHGGIGEVLRTRGALSDVKQYSLAWALVHYLIQSRGAEFGQFQGRLAKGEEPDAAWLAVFPQWDPSSQDAMKDLDKEIGRHVAGGRFAYRTVQLEKGHEVAERPLPSAEAHAVRAGLPNFREHDGDDPRLAAEYAEALREDPGQVDALRFMVRSKKGTAKELVARAIAAHPEDPRTWLLAASYGTEGAEREKAYRRAIELGPEDDRALNELAWFLVLAEREGEALPLARKAAFLAPWNAAILDTYAAALKGLGQCQEALAVQKRAVEVLSEHVSGDELLRYVERVEELEALCGSKKAPAPAAPAAPAKP